MQVLNKKQQLQEKEEQMRELYEAKMRFDHHYSIMKTPLMYRTCGPYHIILHIEFLVYNIVCILPVF